jgi:hypothetical protein
MKGAGAVAPGSNAVGVPWRGGNAAWAVDQHLAHVKDDAISSEQAMGNA